MTGSIGGGGCPSAAPTTAAPPAATAPAIAPAQNGPTVMTSEATGLALVPTTVLSGFVSVLA